MTTSASSGAASLRPTRSSNRSCSDLLDDRCGSIDTYDDKSPSIHSKHILTRRRTSSRRGTAESAEAPVLCPCGIKRESAGNSLDVESTRNEGSRDSRERLHSSG